MGLEVSFWSMFVCFNIFFTGKKNFPKRAFHLRFQNYLRIHPSFFRYECCPFGNTPLPLMIRDRMLYDWTNNLILGYYFTLAPKLINKQFKKFWWVVFSCFHKKCFSSLSVSNVIYTSECVSYLIYCLFTFLFFGF